MTDDTIETTAETTAIDMNGNLPVEPVTAKEKLRAFEDEVLGENTSRINGEIERGIGSPYADMNAHQKAHYAALEQVVKTEKAVTDASAALATAQAAHEAALKAVEAATDEPA